MNNSHCFLRTLSAALLLSIAVAPLRAQASDRTIAQFVHTGWTAKDGVPGVVALAQTTDGFLWLGTARGLYRFDGVSFELYQPRSGDAFPSTNIVSMLALPNGDLWIGYREKGVSLLRGGRNVNFDTVERQPWGRVSRFAQDREGTIWAGSASGLARFESGQWRRAGSDWSYPGKNASALFLDSHGTLWVASERSLFFLPAGSRAFQPTGVKIGQAGQIVESSSGELWFAETSKSVHPLVLPPNESGSEAEIKVGSIAILFDGDGRMARICRRATQIDRSTAPLNNRTSRRYKYKSHTRVVTSFR
jgi:ligand-binding sensor domain-containing protein